MKVQGMKWLGLSVLLVAGVVLAAPSAFAASGSGYRATCKDGTSWSGQSKRGACRGHQGVKSWTREGGSSAAGEPGVKATHERRSRRSKKSEATGAAAAGASEAATSRSSQTRESRSREESASAGGAVNAICTDGTSWSGKSKRGACRGHKGVKSWGAESAAATTPAVAPQQASANRPGPSATRRSRSEGTSGGSMGAPAPGGGAGKVWVNTASKTYHCPGSKWYGTTRHGEYMTEAQAEAQGYHADHGRACSR